MGCAVTKSRSPGVVSATMRAAPTASSSGLQYEGSSSHFLDRNHLGKEKGSVLVTSSSNSPDSGREIDLAKEPQKTVENPSSVRQRLKDKENQDFSFKANTENSVEREKDKKLTTAGNQSLFRPVEVQLRKTDKNGVEYEYEFAPTSTENKTTQQYSVLNDIPDAVVKNVSFGVTKEKERAPTPSKIEFDQQGLAFSFMNIRNSNLNQPNLFYAEDENLERVSQYFNMARSSIFGAKPNEAGDKPADAQQKKKTALLEESSVSSVSCSSPGKQHNLRVMKETKDGNLSSAHGSLSVIDPVEEEVAKEKGMPISSALVATSTALGTHRTTVSSLANLCHDENKRSAFTRKFTTNLVSLVKPMNSSLQLTTTKSLSSMQVPMSSSVLKSQTKVQSTPNLELKNQLSSLTKRKDEGPEDPFALKREQTDKTTNRHDRSINLSCFDIIEDSNEPSPIAEGSFPMTKSNTPKTLLFSNGNTSFSRQVDGSTILDRTIYPLEENITRLDLHQYSINIEMGEKESIAESPQKTPSRPAGRRLSNSFNLNKAKSAILDTQINSATTVIPSKKSENMYSRPKSFCEIDQDKQKETPSSATDVYLSPNRVTRKTAHEQDLNRTNSFIETSRVDKSVDDEGQKKINQYLLIKELGKGGFGKVKLAIHAETKEQYAVKISNKNRLKKKMLTRSKSAFSLLAKEVAIMKKMDHPNIVRLVEVIDDPNHNKLYIAMEFVKKGAVFSKSYWKYEQSKKQDGSDGEESTSRSKLNRLSEEKAKKYFRHLILALDYLHNTVGIIHRDIKPENLLIAADDTLKISDFGISELMEGDNDMLDTNAGTKLYLAPETWKGKSFRGKPADIWAAGGTLYYLLTGRPPFQGLAVDDLRKRITEDELSFPHDAEISSGAKNLIQACLRKNPEERMTLQDIMQDDWLTDNGRDPLENNPCGDLTLSEDDLKKALTKISFMAIVYVTATLKKAHRAKLNVQRKKTQELQHQASLIEK